MRHPGERVIERIAQALLELGGLDDWNWQSAVPNEFTSAFQHVAGCAYCREILAVLIHTEANWGGVKATTPTVIPLRPIGGARYSDDAYDDTDEMERMTMDGYPVDAKSPPRPSQTRTMTLVTDDDRYLVRIMADESGDGAVAVLVPNDKIAEDQAGLRPAIRLAGIDYDFDDKGIVKLPLFPGAEVSLVLR